MGEGAGVLACLAKDIKTCHGATEVVNLCAMIPYENTRKCEKEQGTPVAGRPATNCTYSHRPEVKSKEQTTERTNAKHCEIDLR